jgi:hypothetical protein
MHGWIDCVTDDADDIADFVKVNHLACRRRLVDGIAFFFVFLRDRVGSCARELVCFLWNGRRDDRARVTTDIYIYIMSRIYVCNRNGSEPAGTARSAGNVVN